MIRSKSNMRFQVLANFILILFTIFVITPFILLIMSSFTEESTLIRNGYSFFPENSAWKPMLTFGKMRLR